MNLKVLIIVTLTLILGLSAFGQSISLDSNSIPLNFKSNDFNSVFTALRDSKGNSQKSEFETTEQYNARKKTLVKLDSNKTVEDDFYFLYPAAHLSKYDADAEEFTIEIPTESFYKLNETRQTSLPAKRYYTVEIKEPVIRSDGTFAATNIQGARITVNKSTIIRQGLIFMNFKEVEGGVTSVNREPKLIAKFGLPLAKAKEAKPHLAVLYITKLVNPYFDTKIDLEEATFSKPTEILKTTSYLYGNVSEIWVVDSASGAVYSKLKPVDGFFTNPISPDRVIPAKLIFSPKAEYPRSAAIVNASGSVNVKVEIDENGNVESAVASGGHPYLRPAAEAAARNAKFTPATKGGKPVKSSSKLTFTFNP